MLCTFTYINFTFPCTQMVELSSTESRLELKEEMVQALQNDIVVSVLHACTVHACMQVHVVLYRFCMYVCHYNCRKGRESLIRRVASMKS